MQIVIPMSGFGERFRRAGYGVPKPMIEVDGKPIIAHVMDMFPGEQDVTFVCSEEHLADAQLGMRELLLRLRPSARVVGIAPHKLGPVHAVQHAMAALDPEQPVVVNYCDFSCYWDWHHFKKFVAESGCDGAIPAYRGFHPHSLGTTNYAYLQERGGWATDIREKQPFTDDRMQEYASSGTYYFSSARLMAQAFDAMRAQDLSLNGEYYVSLAYKPLFERGAKVAVYDLQHFLQWGTPEDLREYERWSLTFERLAADARPTGAARGSVVMPMAGLGERFAREGYAVPKPLIEVSGLPMVVQATRDLPAASRHVFVLRADMPGCAAVSETLARTFPNTATPHVPAVTAGQACTAAIGVEALLSLDPDAAGQPLTIGACDSGCLYDPAALQSLFDADGADVLVWVARGHPHAARNPQMYGWIEEADGHIRSVSVKKPLGDPTRDPIVTGTFSFRTPAVFTASVERMLERGATVNGEYYIDTCINDAVALGYACRVMEVDALISWGTPNDLRTFEYWQSCFHKLERHPYKLERDQRVSAAGVQSLAARYASTVPHVPIAVPQSASTP